MNNDTLKWKKAPWNDLPTVWDQEASWCLQMGPAGAGGAGVRICRLSFHPPRVRPPKSMLFDLHVGDEGQAKDVLAQLAVAAEHALAAMQGLCLLENVGIVSRRNIQELSA